MSSAQLQNLRDVRRLKTIERSQTKTWYNVHDGERGAVGQTDQSPSNGVLIHVYDATTNIGTDYVGGPNGTLARIKRIAGVDEVTFVHADHQGTARSGTAWGGAELWEDWHTPFGESLIHPDATDDQGDFTGHIRDKSTGLTYMQARYYDPVIGRFLAEDPMDMLSTDMNPAFFNRYAYCYNEPVNCTDPDGEFGQIFAGAVAGFVIGGGLELLSQALDPNKSFDIGSIGVSGLKGGAAGAVIAATGCVSCGAAVAGGIGAIQGGVTASLAKENVVAGAIKQGGVDFVSTLAGGKAAQGASRLVSTASQKAAGVIGTSADVVAATTTQGIANGTIDAVEGVAKSIRTIGEIATERQNEIDDLLKELEGT